MLTSRLRRPRARAMLAIFAALLAGCGAGPEEPAATTAEPADTGAAETQKSQQAPSPEQRAVVSERLPYMELEDELVYGHFVFPSDMVEPLPAVILVHERWGLNESVRSAADSLAARGYIVFAVDLFTGETTDSPAKASTLVSAVVENHDAAIANIGNAYELVRNTAGAPRVGILGWGFGGKLSLDAAAALGDDLDAVVVYYGQVDSDEESLRPISAPVLAHFGLDDKRISAEVIENLDESMTRLRKNYEIKRYKGVGNSFADPASSKFDVDAADEAREATVEFLELHLSVDDTT